MLNLSQNRLVNVEGLASLPALIALNLGECIEVVRQERKHGGYFAWFFTALGFLIDDDHRPGHIKPSLLAVHISITY